MVVVAVGAEDEIKASRAAAVGGYLFDIGSHFVLISLVGGLSPRVIIPLASVYKRKSAVTLDENSVRIGCV